VQAECIELSEKRMKILLLFAAVYLYRSEFPRYAAMKNKCWSCINLELKMRLQLSKKKKSLTLRN